MDATAVKPERPGIEPFPRSTDYFSALGLKPHLVSVGKALGGGVAVGASAAATPSMLATSRAAVAIKTQEGAR